MYCIVSYILWNLFQSEFSYLQVCAASFRTHFWYMDRKQILYLFISVMKYADPFFFHFLKSSHKKRMCAYWVLKSRAFWTLTACIYCKCFIIDMLMHIKKPFSCDLITSFRKQHIWTVMCNYLTNSHHQLGVSLSSRVAGR